jgi:PAS domain S-box-containing protein
VLFTYGGKVVNTQIIINLINDNQSFLVKRILKYSKLYGYVKNTSTLEEAWRASIEGLSLALINAILAYDQSMEIFVAQDFKSSPITSFGVIEAQKHRSRGITLEMFLGLMKYYRQSYLDLVQESLDCLEQREIYKSWINRYFDQNEIAFCSEWNSDTVSEQLSGLQVTNRKLANEKNKYLTIFESISNPAFVLDKDNHIVNMNFAAQQLINEETQSSGFVYYSNYSLKINLKEVLPWLFDSFIDFIQSTNLERTFEKVFNSPTKGIRYLSIKMSRMLDVSEKFQGSVILFEDLTERKKMEDQLRQKHFNELLETIFQNIQDGIIVIDNKGEISYKNSAALTLLEDFENLKIEKISDLNGEIISFEELPTTKTLRGKCFSDYKLQFNLKENEGRRVGSFSGSPVYNETGNLIMAVLTVRDITEQREKQEKLLRIEREKSEALENSMKFKDEFLYLISHEFKTPLAVVKLALQNIYSHYKEQLTSDIERNLSIVGQNTNRQLRLVNNLLEITRINSKKLMINYGQFDIKYLIQSMVHSVQPIAQQKEVNITFSSTLKKKNYLVDEEKIERIILNLLSNALKFTPSGKSILVSVAMKKYNKKNMISIQVLDEGIGIPKDKQKLIFEKFGQVDTSTTRLAEGIGIGLHLVKLLVNALDGYILLESEESKGSIFTVLIPALKEIREEERYVNQNENLFNERENRMAKEIAIEFSDIYM